MGAGAATTARGLPSGGIAPPAPSPFPPNSQYQGWWNFSARHAGGIVQFGFCDGSVRGLRKGIVVGDNTNPSPAWVAFQAAAGARDGTVVNYELIGN
jgi:prepilin-type processing-associated H-X9-DG protein